MPRDDKSQDVVVNGHIFKRVKMGLDEKDVLPLIQTIIEERDELAKHQDNSPTLTRFIEKIAKEADEWAEQTKKEAREQASTQAKAMLSKAEEQVAHYTEEKRKEAKEQATTEAKAIISRAEAQAKQYLEEKGEEAKEQAAADARAIISSAEEQAAKYVEEKRQETIAASQKEAELLKRQVQIQVEVWVKEIKDNLIIQLRGMGGLLNKEMRAQAEDLKRRAAAFESDFEKQLVDLKKRETTILTGSSPENQTTPSSESVSVPGQITAPQNQKQAGVTPKAHTMILEENLKERKWVEIQIASGEADEIEAFKVRMELQSEVGAAVINKEIDRTTISVFLRKPIDLIQKLMSFSEVKQAQEIVENEQIIYKVSLAKVTPKENMKDNLKEQLRAWNTQG
jgi:hypothetical protein